jgi:hypothetical protein
VEGATLQEAADELGVRLLQIAMVPRSGRIGPISRRLPRSQRTEIVWQVGDYAAAGGDPRELLFGHRRRSDRASMDGRSRMRS